MKGFFACAALLMAVLIGPAAHGQKPIKQKTDSMVEPTSTGRVIGQVYDARTGAPIPGAVVIVEQDGIFADPGFSPRITPEDPTRDALPEDPLIDPGPPSVAKTNSKGLYACESIIGRDSSNFDIGKALSNAVGGVYGMLGTFMGGANTTTHRVDITRVNLRVTCDGYKPFEGVVLCRTLDPSAFAVRMEPVLLVDSASPNVSTTAEGWGIVRIKDLTVTPTVLSPGDRASITVRVQWPPTTSVTDTELVLEDVHRKLQIRLKSSKHEADGTVVFTHQFTIPKDSKPEVSVLIAEVTRCPFDIAHNGGTRRALLQIANTDTGRQLALKRQKVLELLRVSDNVQGAALLKEIVAQPEVTEGDCVDLGLVSTTLHDTATAVSAYKQAIELAPEKPESARMNLKADHARALLANSESQTVVSLYGPLANSVPVKERQKRIPAEMMLTLGNAYIQQNNLKEADRISQELLKWRLVDPEGEVGEFHSALSLAHAQADVRTAPNSAQAHVAYGRVLMNQTRWEEAINEIDAALKIDPNLPAVQGDLAYAILHVKAAQQATPVDLDSAITAIEKQTLVPTPDGKGKPALTKDFFTWHKYAMLLFARSQQSTGSIRDEGMTHSLQTIKQALKCGRTGAEVSGGGYTYGFGYTSPSLVSISGFAYPEANSDFVVMESLRTLEKHPDDYLAHFNLGTALLDLGQPSLAVAPIRHVLELKPEFVEGKYASALLALQNGERERAIQLLKAVIAANPRHPHANLTLAKIYTEDELSAEATACLAAHARSYSTTE